MKGGLKMAVPIGGGLLLAGCVPQVSSAPLPGAGAAPTYSLAGLEAVMGSTAQAVVGRLGQPDLDVREGQARKLQFSGPVCILDAYFYPQREGSEPVVTHVDARLPDGRDVDRASCVAAFIQGRQAR